MEDLTTPLPDNPPNLDIATSRTREKPVDNPAAYRMAYMESLRYYTSSATGYPKLQIAPSTPEHEEAKANVRKRVLILSKYMVRAIKRNRPRVVQHLLHVGVPVNPQITVGPAGRSLMFYALTHDLTSAYVMRQHHGKFNANCESTDPEGNPTQRLMRLLTDFPNAVASGAVAWVQSMPPRGNGPLACAMHAAAVSMGANMPAVHPTWPPPGVSIDLDHPEFSAHARAMVERYWLEMAELRRHEAKALAPYYWYKLRRAVRTLAITRYWWQRAIVRSCAPGGRQRLEDLAAYATDPVLEGLS